MHERQMNPPTVPRRSGKIFQLRDEKSPTHDGTAPSDEAGFDYSFRGEAQRDLLSYADEKAGELLSNE